MKVQVDFILLQRLVECIDYQSKLDQQDEATKARWKAVINETYITASTAIKEFKAQVGESDGRTDVGMGPIISPDKTSYL